MIKKAVLTSLLTVIFLLSSHKKIHASTFWSLLFKTPIAIEQVNNNKIEILNYAKIFQSIRQELVLSAEIEKDLDENPTATTSAVLSEVVPSITPTPTAIATLIPALSPTNTPVPVVSSSETAYILGQINNFRSQNGRSSVSTHPVVCQFADLRAKELSGSFDHSGFSNRKNSNSLPYSSWTKVTENIAMNSNYKEVFNSWRNSAGHANNMLKDTSYICVGKFGNFYAMEGWSP